MFSLELAQNAGLAAYYMVCDKGIICEKSFPIKVVMGYRSVWQKYVCTS